MFVSSKSKLISTVLVGVVFAIAAQASAQNRGFPGRLSEPMLSVGTILNHWQAIQNDLRSTVGQKRRPEFEFRMLAHEIPARKEDGGSAVEQFSADHLPRRIILVMGGLQDSTASAQQFAVALSGALHNPPESRLAVFGYPNDGSISESSAVLREMLVELHRQSPTTRVSVVAHSMGGLVARHALEPVAPNTECQLKCVDQLVMLCPPNHGSVLAQYADALELPDAVSKLQSGTFSLTRWIESLVNDGLGEACEELVPNSPFLRELNSRPRAAGVRYSIIAGSGGPITPLIRLASSVAIKETRERTRIARLPNAKDALNRADELLLSDEFAQGLGDGAVSIQSAGLPGVSEFETIPMSHGEWARTETPQVQQLVQRVAELLGRDPKAAVRQPAVPQRAKF